MKVPRHDAEESDSEQFDAVVVGGGPAGSVAALTLARLGWRVAVIEKRPPGRSKACGHCLHPRGVHVLERLGVAAAALQDTAAVTAPTRRVRVHLPGERPMEARIDRDGAGVVVDRGRFDDRLLGVAAAAGVEVIRPAFGRLSGAGERGMIVEVDSRRLSAGLVVGADGLGSRVASGSLHCRSGERIGFAADLPVDLEVGPEPGVIEMVVVPGGYLGAVRNAPGWLHVAGLIDLTHVRHWRPADLLQTASTILGVEIGSRAAARGRWRMQGAAPMPWRPAVVAGPGLALVGDAAGYVEPFTGEGMGWALESAERLAHSVAGRPPGTWDDSAARAYRRSWRRSIGARHRTCRLVASALRRPRLVAALPGVVRGGVFRWLAGRVMAT